jgi:hypothetical protein
MALLGAMIRRCESKRTISILADSVRFVVRRKALVAPPVQTHHMDPFYVPGVRFELGFLGRDRTFIDVVRRENMGIAKPGQGRFFGLFCRRFRPFETRGNCQT